MGTKTFSTTPNFQNDSDCCHYLGTWFGRDCYVCESKRQKTILVRHGHEGYEYGSHGQIGWNEFHPESTVGGSGEGKHKAEVEIDGICGDNGKAYMTCLAFIAREYIEQNKFNLFQE